MRLDSRMRLDHANIAYMQFNIRDSNVFCAKYLEAYFMCVIRLFLRAIVFFIYFDSSLILLYADGTPLDVYLAQDSIKIDAYLLVCFNMVNLRHGIA